MIQNMSDKKLIAWDSTAVLTPKLFFNEEPEVVLMYRIFKVKKEALNPETDRLYTSFRESYDKIEHFSIPQTYEELISFILDER